MCALTILFCDVDDFWKSFKSEWHKHLLESKKSKRGPDPELSIPEIITIVVLFHQSNYRTFKHFYINHVQKYLCKEFPSLISYTRFVAVKKNYFCSIVCLCNTFTRCYDWDCIC